MIGAGVEHRVRIPGLPLLVLIGGGLVVAAVAWVMGGILLLAIPGGLAVAAFLLWRDRRDGPYTAIDPIPTNDPAASWPPTDIINMSSIRVAGFGGLGLVAMAAAVALGVPAIGVKMLIALVGGAAAAAFVIRRRKRQGPLSSVQTGPEHHTLV